MTLQFCQFPVGWVPRKGLIPVKIQLVELISRFLVVVVVHWSNFAEKCLAFDLDFWLLVVIAIGEDMPLLHLYLEC